MGLKCVEDVLNVNESGNYSWFFDFNTTSNDSVVAVVGGKLTMYIMVAESVVGFICQIINLVVLHGNRIRSLTYTIYLKALSLCYLLGIPFLVLNFLNGLVQLPPTLPTVGYFAHLDAFCINFFLFSGNLIVVALAAEPLRALIWPFQSLSVSSSRAYFILFSIFGSTLLILIPLILLREVMENGQGGYCWAVVPDEALTKIRHVIAAVFEASLVLVVLVIYILLLFRYKGIVKAHKASVKEKTVTPNRVLASNRKATGICIGSVTAYLLCNVPSAVKEILRLADHVLLKRGYSRSAWFSTLVQVANISLLFNYTLNFLLHCAVSSQYRHELLKLFRKHRPGPTTGKSTSTRTPRSLHLQASLRESMPL